MRKTKEFGCEYCFIVESDVFLAPFTLRYLIDKDQPIMTPILRPIPEANDTYSNFFTDIPPSEYAVVAEHRQLGTFRVVGAYGAHLIKSAYVDNLSFQDEIKSEEYFAFARSAMKNNIAYCICNEKEFGSFLHFYKEMSLEEEKAFSLVGDNLEVTPAFLEKIFSSHSVNDPDLRRHLNQFCFDNYAFYRIENRDIFYVDDVLDWIKTLYIKKGRMWEKHIYEVLKAYTKPGTVAVDIGGHIGTHTLTLSRLVGKNGKVHVFEPQVKIFSELVINMALNHCDNIIFHRKALGNKTKWTEVTPPFNTNEVAVQIGKGGERVFMEKLDSLQLNNVSIIKIDIEGHEIEAIEGARKTILRNKPVMIVEILGPELPEKVVKAKQQKIKDLGYRVIHLGDNDYLCLPQ